MDELMMKAVGCDALSRREEAMNLPSIAKAQRVKVKKQHVFKRL
jgi:hypothetical protein